MTAGPPGPAADTTGIHLILRVTGVPPESVSELLGLAPTKVERAGTQPRTGAAPFRSDRWVYDLRLGYADYDRTVTAFHELIASRSAAIQKLPAGSTVCCLVIYRQNPQVGAWLPPSFVALLGSLGIGVEFDAYLTVPQPTGAARP